MFQRQLLSLTLGLCLISIPSFAQNTLSIRNSSKKGSTAYKHAPIGVMGDHMHKKGEWMFSYRLMNMHMDGNRQGTDSIAPVTIATTAPNRFSGVAGQPPTLRVVPTEMNMDMHMLGAMYAPTNDVTFMLMANYLDKSMDHITYSGGAGTAVLGNFSTSSEGWGDTKLSTLIRLYDTKKHDIHANLGLSIPTGSIKETARVLAPNGSTPTLRMPYAMQLGTGTYDLHPGVTYQGYSTKWNWGAQLKSELRLQGENSQGYAWGNKYQASAWAGYQWANWISTSARLIGTTQESIEGIDGQIVAPVQTADPRNYGGDQLELLLGVNLIGTKGHIKDHRLAIEFGAPIHQNLNGIQLETDYTATIGWQYAF